MTVKIFFGTLILMVGATITGFAYWLFPVVDHFHEAMGGGPLKDPTGDWQQQLNTWLSFLLDDMAIRAIIVAAIVASYLFVSTLTTLIALRLRRRKEDRALQKLSSSRAIHMYNANR